MKKFSITLCLTLLCAQLAFAKDPLSPDLIPLSSEAGSALFVRSLEPAVFWPLDLQFVSQRYRTFCSIASSVMVLNALEVSAPQDPVFGHYRFFTQDNFFTPSVSNILPMERVAKQGATLDEISRALRTFGVTVQTLHADTLSMNQFRNLATDALHRAHAGVIVNYLRTALKQTGIGHMSPLGAYDSISDRFLVMDVSRYRYPPVWVKTDDLWRAMQTIDSDSGVYRGLVIIYKQPSPDDNGGGHH